MKQYATAKVVQKDIVTQNTGSQWIWLETDHFLGLEYSCSENGVITYICSDINERAWQIVTCYNVEFLLLIEAARHVLTLNEIRNILGKKRYWHSAVFEVSDRSVQGGI